MGAGTFMGLTVWGWVVCGVVLFVCVGVWAIMRAIQGRIDGEADKAVRGCSEVIDGLRAMAELGKAGGEASSIDGGVECKNRPPSPPMGYIIIEEETSGGLERVVGEKLRKGYRLVGGLSVIPSGWVPRYGSGTEMVINGYRYIQAMALYRWMVA